MECSWIVFTLLLPITTVAFDRLKLRVKTQRIRGIENDGMTEKVKIDMYFELKM